MAFKARHLPDGVLRQRTELLVAARNDLAGAMGTQTARLLLARVVLGAFWIGLAITILILTLDDDALERWCKHCTYRLDKQLSLLGDKDELTLLFKFLCEVV
ncbi:hypothetical protein [Pseudomonas fontis]|uniref:Uncharacterized protein n=1 Tax=Pseudomonas fontis TaxID=2942633 RepID=A0ABT5P0D0_9PSED|nr:hypothetical protein [Pseudomonas fontis]MDD0972912.1 hypothetical protein [Pseudomonas fontis]MDD0993912.1 hypothetical protein [Pseudomonas fontis]